jgi:NAD(P)-dependent dehydrogenase (short-subunit alcohol dehydrogenase family)
MKSSVIITGGGGNLGSAVVKKLKTEGYRLLGTAVNEKEFKRLEEKGVETVQLDLADEPAVKAYIQDLDENPEAAILIVGGFAAGGFRETSGEDLRKMYSLNFETAFFITQSLLPRFEERGGGQIILIGTRPALNPEEGKDLIAYSLSKKLVFYLADLINAYGKGKNITATVIVPSTIDTPVNRKFMSDADFSKWVSPEAIADAIHFVLTDSGKQMRDSVIKMYNKA